MIKRCHWGLEIGQDQILIVVPCGSLLAVFNIARKRFGGK